MGGIVLFTQRVEVVESYKERRDCADQRIADFIRACGYLPVPVPNKADIIKEIVEAAKPAGVVLTGGNSLVKYGGNAPERDEADRLLIGMAADGRIPLYGFCRGMQSILDYFGSGLVDVAGHVARRHRVSGGESSMEVNSYHRQGCVRLAAGPLAAVMWSEDGVIEMVRHKELPIAGTMWHPEREEAVCGSDIDLVRTLMGGIR